MVAARVWRTAGFRACNMDVRSLGFLAAGVGAAAAGAGAAAEVFFAVWVSLLFLGLEVGLGAAGLAADEVVVVATVALEALEETSAEILVWC